MDKNTPLSFDLNTEETIALEFYNLTAGIESINQRIIDKKSYHTFFELNIFSTWQEAQDYILKMLGNVLCFDRMGESEKDSYFASLIEYGKEGHGWNVRYDYGIDWEGDDLIYYNTKRLPSFMAIAFMMKYLLGKEMKLQEDDEIYQVMKKNLNLFEKHPLFSLELDAQGSKLTEYYLLVIGGFLLFEEQHKSLMLDYSGSIAYYFTVLFGEDDFFEEFNIPKFDERYEEARTYLQALVEKEMDKVNEAYFQIIVYRKLEKEAGWEEVFKDSFVYKDPIDNGEQYIYEDGSECNGGKFLSEVKLYDEDLTCLSIPMKHFEFVEKYIALMNMEMVSVELDLDGQGTFTSVYGMIMK